MKSFIAKAIEYMLIGGNLMMNFAEAVFEQIAIYKFLCAIGVNMYGCRLGSSSDLGLMMLDNEITTYRDSFNIYNGYNAKNVRLLLYYMMKIVSEEKTALLSGDYDRYIELLKLEKKYAERILEILCTHGVAATVESYAKGIFVDYATSWKYAPLYIEVRKGLEQLYTTLADAWLFEYTYILNGESERPPYGLQLKEIYWLPYVDASLEQNGAELKVVVNVSTVKNYAYRGGLRVEVYPVYKIWFSEFTSPWPIAEKDFDSIEIRYPETYQVSVSFTAPWLKPYKYLVVVYSINATIISDEYTAKLRQSEEQVLITWINVYDKYFSKIEVRRLEFVGGKPITSGSLVRLDESKHKLYLAVLTDRGVVGYRDRDVVVEIPGALFLDIGNGTQIAYLPPEVSNFTVVVDARDAVYDLEEYNLTVVSFNESGSGLAVLSASVERGEQQRVAVSWREGRISIEPVNIRNYRVVYSENAEIVAANRTATGSATQIPIPLTTTTVVILAVAATSLLAVIAVRLRKRRH